MPFGQSGSISVWITVYGIGPSRSATGSATVAELARRAPSPSSTGPAETAMNAATFLPCHSSGITGSGGAVVRLTSAGDVVRTRPAPTRGTARSRSPSASAG